MKQIKAAKRHPAIKAAADYVVELLESRVFLSAGYTPDQIRAAYGLGPVAAPAVSFGDVQGDGTGQTIALIEAFDDPNLTGDISTFDSQFGLSAPSISVMGVGGAPVPNSGETASAALEEVADVEWVHATAPGANIDVIECASQSAPDLDAGAAYAAGLAGVSVVSESLSTPENSPTLVTNAGDYTTPSQHQGVTFLAASGDDGGNPGYPSDLPTVVGVGGTVLTTTDASGDYSGETAWSGSNGGPSALFSRPSFQSGITLAGNTSGADPVPARLIPDVSAEAGGAGYMIYDSYDSTGWQADTGTSLSTPFWAGLIAIANQGRIANGLTTLDGASQTLPLLYGAPNSDFHDITSGSNNNFSALTGYDLVTGIGSPIANELIPYLANSPPTVAKAPTATATILGGGKGEEVSLAALGAQGGIANATSLTYQWTVTGPNGVTFSDSGNTNADKVDSATITQPGTYVFTVTITNSFGLDVVASAPSLMVVAVPEGATVSPGTTGVVDGQKEQFAVSATDQFGNPYTLSGSDTVTWSALDGSITQSGQYTAPASGAGTDTVSVQVSNSGNGGIPAEGSATVSFAGALGVGQIFTANGTYLGAYTATGATVSESLPEGLNGPEALAVSGSDLFVANVSSGTIGEYTTSGAIVNVSLIAGLNDPDAIAISGSDLFVVNNGSATIGEYTTSGATVDTALISGLASASLGIAVSGSDLFVTSNAAGGVAEYTTSGGTVSSSLITGLSPVGIAVSGTDLFVVNGTGVSEYSVSGALVDSTLITGLDFGPEGIAISGSDIYVSNQDNSIAKYTISGTALNVPVISGLSNNPVAIAASGSDLFIAILGSNLISEYSTTGSVVNQTLISGLSDPTTLAISGSDLFVADAGNGTIDEYSTTGVPIATPLISGLTTTEGIAISGSDLFIADSTDNEVGEYTTSGAVVNAALITGLNEPEGIAISGSDLFVTNSFGSGASIGEYTTSGAVVNATLIPNLNQPDSIAVSGSDLFVGLIGGGGAIGEYTTSGALINAALISDFDPLGIAVSGPDLFITNAIGSGYVGEYTTAGAMVNASLVSTGIANVSGVALISPPVIVTDPESDTATAGADASFTALASGGPNPSVQWQVAPAGSSTFTPIVGATSPTLDVGTVAVNESGDKYEAVFSNGEGLPATTTAATLTVTAPPQPPPVANDDTFSTPENTTLTVAPDGLIGNDFGTNIVPVVLSGPKHGFLTVDQSGNVSYVPDGGYSGTDTFTYEDANFNDAQYANIQSQPAAPFTLTNLQSYPTTDYTLSNVATFTISVSDNAPVVSQNGGETVTEAAGAQTDLVVQAAGTPAPTVQWYELNENLGQTSFVAIPGATATTAITGGSQADLNLGLATAALNGTYYQAVFTNSSGSSDSIVFELNVLSATDDGYSTAANQTLTIAAPGVLNNDFGLDADAQVVDGPSYGTLTLGSDGDFTYTPTSNSPTGTDTFTYEDTFSVVITPDEIKPPGNKQIVNAKKITPEIVRDDQTEVVSNTATVTIFVGTPAAITLNPTSQSLTVGTDAQFTVGMTGSPTPAVQWYVEDAGTSVFTPADNATSTSPTLDLGPATLDESGNLYEAVVTGGDGGSLITTPATLTVNTLPAPAVTLTAPASGTFTNDATPTFSGTASDGTGYLPTITLNVYRGNTAIGTPVQTLMATQSGGTYSVVASPALADGIYTAQASQSDSAGDTSTSGADTFTIDTTAPAVTLSVPTNGSAGTNTPPAFGGTAGTAAGDLPAVTVKIFSGSTATGTPVQTLTTTESGGTYSAPASAALPTGTYTAQASQADSAGNVGTSNANTFTISASSSGGSLVGAFSTAVGTYNLTALGTLDWAHWGTASNPSAFDYKATGGSQISNVTRLGSANYGAYSDPSRTVTWTDGTPQAIDTGDQSYIWANNAIGAGYSFTAPADTTTRTVYVYLGGYSSGGTLTATLSDTSAPPYSVSFSGSAIYTDLVAITYNAGSSGQTLKLSYVKTKTINGIGGSVDLIAAWLDGTPAGPNVITGPTSTTVAAGATVNFTASASGTPPATVQWQISTDGGKDFSDITGATSTTYSFTATASESGDEFRAVFTNLKGNATTAQATLTVAPTVIAPKGLLSGAASTAASKYNLTTLGTLDWAHWGTASSASVFDHKATGGSQISNVTRLGSANYGAYSDPSRTVTWTDGTPQSTDSGDQSYIWANNAIGAGYSFTVPADTTTRTVYVYLGGYSSGGTLTATLSDNSAPAYTVSFSGSSHYNEIVAITYKAAAAGQKLNLSYVKSQTINGSGGSVDLIAAWLQ